MIHFALRRALNEPEAEASEDSLVDEMVLSELAETIGAQKFKTLLSRLLEQGDEIVGLCEAYAADDSQPQPDIPTLHRFAGSVGMFGASAVAAAITEVESAFKRSGDGPSQQDCEALATTWKSTRAELVDLLD